MSVIIDDKNEVTNLRTIDVEFKPRAEKIGVYNDETETFFYKSKDPDVFYNKIDGSVSDSEFNNIKHTTAKPPRPGFKFNSDNKRWEYDFELTKQNTLDKIEHNFKVAMDERRNSITPGVLDFWNIIDEEVKLFTKRKRENDVPFLLEYSRYSKHSIEALVVILSKEMSNVKTDFARLLGQRQADITTVNNTKDNVNGINMLSIISNKL